MNNENGITVVLNGFRRPHTLQEQYEAVRNQSVGHVDVMFWGNYSEGAMEKFPHDVIEGCTSAFCNQNLGVWARFAFALNAYTRYICVLDDDTIPGSRWLENCLNTIQTHTGLIGCRGLRMSGDDYLNYPNCKYDGVGGGSDNTEPVEVDIIGHSWFFEREWLRAFWAEMPRVPLFSGGEDMHFSFAIQKQFGLKSYVPVQPPDEKELWGSTCSAKYGEDDAATSRTQQGHAQANAYWRYIVEQGDYELVKDRS